MEIEALHQDSKQTYGSRKITASLRRQGNLLHRFTDYLFICVDAFSKAYAPRRSPCTSSLGLVCSIEHLLAQQLSICVCKAGHKQALLDCFRSRTTYDESLVWNSVRNAYDKNWWSSPTPLPSQYIGGSSLYLHIQIANTTSTDSVTINLRDGNTW
ncbi:MAG: transposase [Peptococcaceae bacterium]|nr:transposase [Peptococcaceae bacterium]